MAERFNVNIRASLIVISLLLLAWAGFYCRAETADPYRSAMAAAHRAFKDGDYRPALQAFVEAEAVRADDANAIFGQALALMQLDRGEAALAAFSRALLSAGNADIRAYLLANRGILHDRKLRYREALEDYDQALKLNPKVAEGPGAMLRFVHNQAERPPSIADRARYLRQELTKPEHARLLSLPEQDARQYPYKP